MYATDHSGKPNPDQRTPNATGTWQPKVQMPDAGETRISDTNTLHVSSKVQGFRQTECCLLVAAARKCSQATGRRQEVSRDWQTSVEEEEEGHDGTRRGEQRRARGE
jgi:hypothetical protein